MANLAALIVAAGRGTRAGGPIPKQYRPIGDVPVLERAIAAFLAHDAVDWVQVVIHPDDRAAYDAIHARLDDGKLLDPVTGAADRTGSVRAGLDGLAEYAPQKVLIHDGARPFVGARVIDGVIAGLATHQAAVPMLPVVDALWHTDLTPADRSAFQRAQTPQGFDFAAITAAMDATTDSAVDDISLAVAAGLTVTTTIADETNFKVTTADDFDRAEPMARTAPDIRTGTGFDVHAFAPGDAVILNGITIPHDHALKGHSDADVAMHAITDAIYGALADGDIGQWFPPSAAEWKGAASDIFLRHAMERVAARGFVLTHIDCTIICELPKIGPYATAMREKLSTITGLYMDRISVKATTSEQLGFTGRGEGIAAMATATVVKP